MALTPIEVENTRFRGALGGYNRIEVDQFLMRVSRALEDQLSEIQALNQRVTSLEKDVATHRESEELLKNSVMLAQRTCDELIAMAHKKAELIQDEALQEGDEIKRQYAELRSQREQFEYAFHGLLTGFINRLEQGNQALGGTTVNPAIAAQSVQPVEPAPPARQDPLPASAHDNQESVASGFASIGQVGSSGPLPYSSLQNQPGQRSEARPGQPASGQADRDQDFSDFNAAISSAEPDETVWPGEEPEPSPADPGFLDAAAAPASTEPAPLTENLADEARADDFDSADADPPENSFGV